MVLIPNTNFVVDGFKYSSALDKPYYIFFLTHMHADHWAGLTPSWNRGPIYCSPITARMLTHKFPGIQNVTALELDEPHFIYMDQNQTTGVNITFIDANHIPGAVMILFQSPTLGNILHTGDFRYKPDILNHPSLRDSSNSLISIDHLFLDNTFGKEDFNFPPADQCTSDIIEIIQSHPDSDIWIANDALGKEELLLTLAKYFKTLVVVSQVRYRDIELMGYDASWFTTNSEDGWIHCITTEEIKKIGNRNREGSNTIGFYMSGWFKTKSRKGPYIYVFYI